MSIFMIKIGILVLAIVILGRMNRPEGSGLKREAVRVRTEFQHNRVNGAQ